MKRFQKLATAAAAILAIAGPQTTTTVKADQQPQKIQQAQSKERGVQIAQTVISSYTAPRRFTEGSSQGKRRKWSRGPMSFFKQKMQHKKYAKSKK